MQDINEFLAYAIRLEEEAAARFHELAAIMDSYGNADVAALFKRLGEFSAQHAQTARDRGGFHDLPRIKPGQFQWPEGQSPEATSMEGSHYLMTVDYAMGLALESEKAGQAYYQSVADTSDDPEVKIMAAEFAEEESGHVAELERWLVKLAS
jgi:rubrerythrin